MLVIIISVVLISFCSIMIFWYVTDYSIRSNPFHEFSDDDIITEEGKSMHKYTKYSKNLNSIN